MTDSADLCLLAVDLAFVGALTWAGLLALLGGQTKTSGRDTLPGSERV